MAKINITNQVEASLPNVDSGKSFLYVDSVSKKASIKDDTQSIEVLATKSYVDTNV